MMPYLNGSTPALKDFDDPLSNQANAQLLSAFSRQLAPIDLLPRVQYFVWYSLKI
jgi:hypothetical protein